MIFETVVYNFIVRYIRRNYVVTETYVIRRVYTTSLTYAERSSIETTTMAKHVRA